MGTQRSEEQPPEKHCEQQDRCTCQAPMQSSKHTESCAQNNTSLQSSGCSNGRCSGCANSTSLFCSGHKVCADVHVNFLNLVGKPLKLQHYRQLL